MKITLYYSGGPRTATHTVPLTIAKIKEKNPNIVIDVRYSFWKSLERKNKENDSSTGLYGINDPWHYEAQNLRLDEGLLCEAKMNDFFMDCGVDSAEGELEDMENSKQIMENSPFPDKLKFLSSQNYRINRIAKKFPIEDSDWGLRIRPDVRLMDFPDLSSLLEDSLILNTYFWYNGVDTNLPPKMCNELFWLANKNVFLLTSSFLDYQGEIASLGLDCGESMTAAFFGKLYSEDKISISFFDFQYRVAR